MGDPTNQKFCVQLSLSHLRLSLAPLVGKVGVNDVVEGAGDPAADSSARPLVRMDKDRDEFMKLNLHKVPIAVRM